jgi:hypothetical protein
MLGNPAYLKILGKFKIQKLKCKITMQNVFLPNRQAKIFLVKKLQWG